MCSGAILLYKIPKVVVGESQTFLGNEALLRSRGVAIPHAKNAQCVGLMRRFTAANPALWNKDIGKEKALPPTNH